MVLAKYKGFWEYPLWFPLQVLTSGKCTVSPSGFRVTPSMLWCLPSRLRGRGADFDHLHAFIPFGVTECKIPESFTWERCASERTQRQKSELCISVTEIYCHYSTEWDETCYASVFFRVKQKQSVVPENYDAIANWMAHVLKNDILSHVNVFVINFQSRNVANLE